MAKRKGNFIQSKRCMVCNKLGMLDRINDSGKILNDSGVQVDCPNLCTKGWFTSRGIISS